MSISAWIEERKKLKLLNAPKYNHPKVDVSYGLWTRCDQCGGILYIKHLKENRRVCFDCGYYLQMNSQERIDHLIDTGTWRCLDETLSPCDPLEFWDQKAYIDRLKESQERTGFQDAIQTGTGMLYDIPIALGVMDFSFMGGSMGSVVGEKITRLIEYATQEGLTLILVCASGGARMQEGVLSLMQMAKISAALQIYQNCANLLYISILTSPTTGGVTASFAMLADLIFAEPKALIGFAGRRVIEQTLQEQLPDNFQTSEYLLHHGLLDLIISRSFIKSALYETITLYKDAPLKRSGTIPYGIQQNLNFITEEKIRRKWAGWKQILETDVQYNKSYSEKLIRLGVGTTSPQDGKKTEPNITESFYREILTSFETMVEFFALPITVGFDDSEKISPVDKIKNLQEGSDILQKNKVFTDANFNKFISQCLEKTKSFEEGFSTLHQGERGADLSSQTESIKFTENTSDSSWRGADSLALSQANSQFLETSKLPNNVLDSSKPQSKAQPNTEIIEWRILSNTQNKNTKKSFLNTFINGKHKHFFIEH